MGNETRDALAPRRMSAVRFQYLTLKTSGCGRSNTNIRAKTTQDSVLSRPDDVVRWTRLRCNFHIQSHLLLDVEVVTCHDKRLAISVTSIEWHSIHPSSQPGDDQMSRVAFALSACGPVFNAVKAPPLPYELAGEKASLNCS